MALIHLFTIKFHFLLKLEKIMNKLRIKVKVGVDFYVDVCDN